MFEQSPRVSTLLSRDSKAREVEDLDVFIPVEVVEKGFPLSTPWLPCFVIVLQGLALLFIFFPSNSVYRL